MVDEVLNEFPGSKIIKTKEEKSMEGGLKFRTLKASEIETRVQQVKEKGCILLLYKDSRADMKILDETVGVLGWQRRHTRDNKNCIVSIWDDSKEQWIEKEDTGTESNTEQAKGLASDSFKRSCVNLGIGRELYSSPFIWINLNSSEVKKNGTRYQLGFGVEFKIKEIGYNDDREISKLIIVDKNNKIRFKLEEETKSTPTKKTDTKPFDKSQNPTKAQIEELKKLAESKNISEDRMKDKYSQYIYTTPLMTIYNKALKEVKAFKGK